MRSGHDRPTLFVEGPDDQHVVIHVLDRYGVSVELDSCRDWYPSIQVVPPGRNKDELLRIVTPMIEVGHAPRLGFLVDANSSLAATWKDLRERFLAASVSVPEGIPREGFVGVSDRYGKRVGAWLMPDNEQPGAVEEFLMTLIPSDDSLWPYAREATEEAKGHGAEFPSRSFPKAALRTWLAWQETPGMPYGTAIRRQFFHAAGETADRFVDWFRRLFERPDPGHPSPP